MKKNYTYLSRLLFLLLLITGCHKNDIPAIIPVVSAGKPAKSYSGQYLRSYYTLLCRISKSTSGFFPPQVARAYGYIGIANYEAVVNGIDSNKSLQGQITDFTIGTITKPLANKEYNWAISSNAATAEILRRMFEQKITPANLASIDSLENTQLTTLSTNVTADIVNRSKDFGKSVATSVYQYSINDGGNLSYLDPFQLPFTMPADDFCWIPTSSTMHSIAPKWGTNRPFLTQDVNNTQPSPHIAFSTDPSSSFYKEAMNVYTQVKNNTFDQVDIVRFWADDPFRTCTPCGHTFNIMIQLLEEDNASLEKSSVGFAALGIGENDAFISCWKTKFTYNLIRPVSYIKKYVDPTFNTVIGTPPFPAYTSGHSCEIGAGTRVFIKLFTNGNGYYSFSDRSQLQYGFPIRNYSNFDEMASECANSRFYGGIHYDMDNVKGLQSGKAIGNNVITMIHWPQNTQ